MSSQLECDACGKKARYVVCGVALCTQCSKANPDLKPKGPVAYHIIGPGGSTRLLVKGEKPEWQGFRRSSKEKLDKCPRCGSLYHGLC